MLGRKEQPMKQKQLLLFGPIAAAVLFCGIYALAATLPGYSSIHQTVSEIGEVGSPARIPFTVLICVVSGCLLLFAAAMNQASKAAVCAPWTAYFIVCMAVSAAGVGIFAFPHPLHNVFGMSELIGYQAPLVFALTWRHNREARRLVKFSWVMFVLVWLAVVMNMSSIDPRGAIWEHLRPVYGVVQRSLFAAWFFWSAVIGVALWRSQPQPNSR
jgi:hypothetical membrane protein